MKIISQDIFDGLNKEKHAFKPCLLDFYKPNCWKLVHVYFSSHFQCVRSSFSLLHNTRDMVSCKKKKTVGKIHISGKICCKNMILTPM